MNSPRCDGEKIIKVEKTICVKAKDAVMWTFNEQTIEEVCDGVNHCNIDKMVDVVSYCCGDETYRLNKRPKLRFVYDCVQGQATTKSTTPKMTTTLPAAVNTLSTKHTTTHSSDFDNFCVANVCHQKPYCSAGTEIAVMKVSDTMETDQVMNSLTYYCNKRQRCTEEFEPYIDNKCRSEDSMKLHYVCMKEKVTTTVMCDYDETIANLEGQIRSLDYPNMIPASTSNCRIKILFDEPSIVELFLLDLPTMEVMYADEYMEWSSPMTVSSRHEFIPSSYEVLLSVDFDKLPQRRIWMYYRVFPTMTMELNVESDLMWTTTCMNPVTTPEPMNMTTPKNTPSTPEMSKVTMFKVSNSTTAGKDMHPMHKTEANQGAQESSTTSHIVIPDGIPVDTEVGDKMAPSTFPAMPPTAGSGTSISSIGGGDDGRPVEKDPHHPTRHENKEKVSSVSGTPTTGLYSREVVIGLIAGVVILACLVIILLTALAASMRRNPPNTVACGTTKPPIPPPPSNAAHF